MGILGSVLAVKQAKKVSGAFNQAFREQYGTYPPLAATEAVQSATAIILSFSGTGREKLGAERLSACIDDYCKQFPGDEDKIAAGLICIASICMTSRGTVAFGYTWAADVVAAAILMRCPSYTPF